MTRSATVLVVGALLAATVGVMPAGAAVEPVVTVSPATDLVDGQSVHVAITGATPSTETFSLLCAVGSVEFSQCDERLNHGGTIDPQGALEFDIGLEAEFGLVSGVTVDCRRAGGTGCVLLSLFQSEAGAVVEIRTPLTFRPDVPLLPPPTITVTPSTDLVDGTIAHVSGTGFVAGMGVTVVQCRAPFTGGGDCESPRIYAAADGNGALSVDVDLGAVLETNDGTQVDCRLVACTLVATREVFESDPRHTTSVSLSFRPDGPLRPPPVITVEPSTGLVDGQQVQITGSGFRSGSVVVSQCGPGTDPIFERCPGFLFVSVDSSGELSTTLPVAVLARVGSGYTDCRVAPGCSIAVRSDLGFQVLTEVPISFDPAGPAPTFPTLSVAPATGLPARSPVIVAGHGFPAERGLEVRQCLIEQGLPSDCEQSNTFLGTDATGAFIAGATVTAVMAGPDGTEIDCRTVTCALVADEYSQGLPGIAPLQFAPAPTKPRRYFAPVFDEVELTEGVVYRQATNSHGVNVDLKLDVYRPQGDTATRRPAVMWMFGGYFGSGERTQLSDLAKAMARRGYVSVAIDYRTRPEIFSNQPGCLPVGGACLDPTQLLGAITDARDDARAAMVFLHDHATEYGIEPAAIAAAGWSAGAVTALNLAHDITGDPPAASVPAAAVSLAGILTSVPRADDPPTMMLGGNQDSLLGISGQIGGCAVIVTAGGHCDFVEYAGTKPAPEADACVKLAIPCTYVLGRDQEHGFLFQERPDVIERMSEFLGREVLEPAGLLPRRDPNHHPHHSHHWWWRHHHHHRDGHDDDHGQKDHRRHG